MPRKPSSLVITLALAALFVGCASPGGASPGDGSTAPAAAAASASAPELAPSPSAAVAIHCRQSDMRCLGVLQVGAYTSTEFLHPVTYTVPKGWANAQDEPDRFSLDRETDFINEAGSGSSNIGPSLYIFPDPQAALADATCDVTAQPGVGSSSDALASSIAKRPGIVATKPTAVTIGGRTGMMVDVQVAPTWTKMCSTLDANGVRSGAPVPYVALIRGENAWEWGPDRPAHERYIFLDIDSGKTVAIVLDGAPQEFDKLVADAMPIVQSMTFQP